MTEVVGDGPRVKFRPERRGAFPAELKGKALELLDAVLAMEAAGCCPVLDDGMVAGNGARRVGNRLLVTRSGRPPGARDEDQVVCVDGFDAETWSAHFRSDAPSALPTSDTALHWAALMDAPARQGWRELPQTALHGHGWATAEDAATLGVPISPEATDFSTPADREALLALLAKHPYPEDWVWIRRGHGFFVLGPTVIETERRCLALRAMRLSGAR